MRMIIGGNSVEASDRQVVEVLNPYDGTTVDTVPLATEDDVRLAIETAGRGQRLWTQVPLHERENILRRYIEVVDANQQDLGRIMTLEHGRPFAGQLADVRNNVANIIPAYIGAYKHFTGQTTQPGGYSFNTNDFQMVVREPLGVVAAVIAFNSPVNIFVRKVIPALITGNAIVVKPASEAPLAVIRMTELLLEAGVTAEAVNLVTGRGSQVGRWISESPGVDAISFTGSTEVGIDIIQRSCVNMTRCHMELGGNDAFIVLDDADVDLAVKAARSGRTPVTGQVCAAPKRFIVDRTIVDQFTEKLLDALKQVVVGDPMDPTTEMGPMISERAAAVAVEQIDHTVRQGAKVVLGGTHDRAFIEPTVLTGVTKDMDIAQDLEIFAPVFPIIAVDSEEEAVDIANNTVYGLSGSVFSSDYKRAIHVARQLQTGQVAINSHGWYLNPEQPFGGYKKSGKGREGVHATLSEFTQEKTITLKDFIY